MNARSLTVDVFDAYDIVTADGVMRGESISFADDLVLDDVFHLLPGRETRPLRLKADVQRGRLVREDGLAVHIDSCLTLMDHDGGTHEVLILVTVCDGHAEAIHVMPLAELLPRIDYRLVGIARHTATMRFAEAASGSFASGTRISLRDGSMCPIEALQVGDLVLTRDAGPQPVRQITRATLRAAGSFAPVVIAAGILNNEGELVVRPDHRLFVYQREDRIGAGRAEVLVKARHLVDGKKITRRKGGFIDYYQLVFDAHHIIFAEGIAAESHLVDPHPGDTKDGSKSSKARKLHDYEVRDNLIPLDKAAALLRGASSG